MNISLDLIYCSLLSLTSFAVIHKNSIPGRFEVIMQKNIVDFGSTTPAKGPYYELSQAWI